jgi:hypothetical protein
MVRRGMTRPVRHHNNPSLSVYSTEGLKNSNEVVLTPPPVSTPSTISIGIPIERVVRMGHDLVDSRASIKGWSPLELALRIMGKNHSGGV